MEDISRRDFIKRTFAAGATGALVLSTGKNGIAEAGTPDGKSFGTFIDLTKCDGCAGKVTPLCVSACRIKNNGRFPDPKEPIPDNWPTGKKEDWSKKREMTDKLTPYNWTYVQTVKVEGKELNVPRRCMHCDNPPCANLCPFGVQDKTAEGAVVIDHDGCFGGAKCRDVCPWDIPQRQAGVGLYMKIAPGLIGGGVMYKCDLCIDLIRKGKNPACVDACPNAAAVFGEKEEVRELAQARAGEIGGHIYGDKENGGTSTFYVSPVSFDKVHAAIMAEKEKAPKPERVGIPGMKPGEENYLDTGNGMILSYAVAPVAGALAAGVAAYRVMKGEK
ncbi:MAG: 4Fe-4S dicluster domain-containing protein [Actinobacteria bacterium]|nr:4Fe-4S dicluster domain-containing protein [Actinomycetota bacterium]